MDRIPYPRILDLQNASFQIRTLLLGIALLNPPPATGQTPPEEPSSVVFVDVLPLGGANAHYVAHRPPLQPNPLLKLPIGAITPQGWLRTQLEFMRTGMIGRLSEISPWLNREKSAWMNPKGEGEYGWEELPYWLKGFGDLGYVLKDPKLMAEARQWLDAVLAGQEADGWFGPRENKKKRDVWPNMPILNALQSFYEATGDARVIPFMLKYFRWQLDLPKEDLLPESWQKVRGGDNLESVLWLYNRTGEPWLLELAKKIHERTIRWDEGVANWHGVNICQGFREPAVYWTLAGDRKFLDAAERNYQTVMQLYGQVPGGMFAADENCRAGYNDPRQAAEACSMVEFMHSFEMLLKFTGDPLYADRCEEVAFNSLPAALTPDLKALHYLTAPNVPRLDAGNKSPGLENGGCMLAYSPHERYRCCQHNVAMGWPYYAQHLWCATRDNGLAAVLYAACEIKAKVAGGAEVTIKETTDYPFDENVEFTISTAKSVRFPLYLRVPQWCADAKLLLNGKPVEVKANKRGYIRIDRTWSDGDKALLQLPMEVEVKSWPAQKNAVSIHRGPLAYSLKIGERWARSGGTHAWPEYEVFPTTPWNYGLVLDAKNPAAAFTVARKSGIIGGQPFQVDSSPIELTAPAKKIPGWQLDYLGLIGPLQAGPAKSAEPAETVTLVPMGCARLRISMFPVIGDGPDARDWTPPPRPRHRASHLHDDPNAPSDGKLPKNSNDHSVPRFTWWDHRGTAEWIEYSFDKPRKVSACEVYWFDDAPRKGACRAPASWKLLYKRGDEWREVGKPSEYGVALDRFNRVTFEPVETDALRIEVKLQKDFSSGVLEWKVE